MTLPFFGVTEAILGNKPQKKAFAPFDSLENFIERVEAIVLNPVSCAFKAVYELLDIIINACRDLVALIKKQDAQLSGKDYWNDFGEMLLLIPAIVLSPIIEVVDLIGALVKTIIEAAHQKPNKPSNYVMEQRDTSENSDDIEVVDNELSQSKN